MDGVKHKGTNLTFALKFSLLFNGPKTYLYILCKEFISS